MRVNVPTTMLSVLLMTDAHIHVEVHRHTNTHTYNFRVLFLVFTSPIQIIPGYFITVFVSLCNYLKECVYVFFSNFWKSNYKLFQLHQMIKD